MTLCGNAGGYVVAILMGIVVARVLGPANKGVVSYAALIMALFTTFGSGLQAGIMHECGRLGRPTTAAYAASIQLLGLTMLPVALLLALIGVLDPGHASFVYVAVAVPFGVYTQIAGAIFMIENDLRTLMIQSAIPTVGSALLTVPALLFFHGGLTAVLTIWALTFVAAGLFGAVRLRAHLSPAAVRAPRGLVRDEGTFALKSGFSSLATFLNLRIDVFVVGIMLDARTLGIYTLAVATGELMWQVSRPLVTTTSGRVAAQDRPHAIALTAKVARHLLAIESLLGIAIYFCAPVAVRLVYGPAYAESADVMRWLLPGLVLYAAQSPLNYYIMVKEGRPMATFAVQTACVCLCAAIAVATIRQLGIFGAALATTVTYCFAAAITAWMFARITSLPAASFTLLGRNDLARIRALAWRYLPCTRYTQAGAESS